MTHVIHIYKCCLGVRVFDRSLGMVSKTFDCTCGNQNCVFYLATSSAGKKGVGLVANLRNGGEKPAAVAPLPPTSSYCPLITPSKFLVGAHTHQDNIHIHRHWAFCVASSLFPTYILTHTRLTAERERRQSCLPSFLLPTDQSS